MVGSSVKDRDNWTFCCPATESFSLDRVITLKIFSSVAEIVQLDHLSFRKEEVKITRHF